MLHIYKRFIFTILTFSFLGFSSLSLANDETESSPQEFEYGYSETTYPVSFPDAQFNVDTLEAKNIITSEFGNDIFLKNLFFTMIDIIHWEMATYPNYETIGEYADLIMLNSYCLASNVDESRRNMMMDIFQLMISWHADYRTAFYEIGYYLQENHPLVLPEGDGICDVFNEYPSKEFNFIYKGENDE